MATLPPTGVLGRPGSIGRERRATRRRRAAVAPDRGALRALHRRVRRTTLEGCPGCRACDRPRLSQSRPGASVGEQLQWPLRKVQRLVEIHEAPQAVKHAIVSGIDIEGTRRTLSVSHALDVVRAFTHYARANDSATEQEATARLDRLIARVLKEEWSAGKLQQYVGALGRSPKRDPLDRAERDAEDDVPRRSRLLGHRGRLRDPAADNPGARLLPQFEAKADASQCS
jgi:hypothetical protein